MITLTRFNQTQVAINAELIETVEATPDTVLTMVTSRKFLVRETVEEVIHRVIEYRKAVGPSSLPWLEEAKAQEQQTGNKEQE